MEPTIYVVDDDDGVRGALAALLTHKGLRVAAYASGKDFLAAYHTERPGCLLLDLRIPDMDGLAIQQELASHDVRLPIVFMSAHGTVRDSVQAMKGGAVDFLEKPFSREALLTAIQQALAVDQRMRVRREQHADVATRYHRLSDRERDILKLIVGGKSGKDIAKILGISPRTVDHHRFSLMAKMQASSLAELGAIAAEFPPPPGKEV